MPRGKPGTGKAALVAAANPLVLMMAARDALQAVPRELRPHVIASVEEPKRRKRRKKSEEAEPEPAPAPKKSKKKKSSGSKSKKADLIQKKKERAAELEAEE